MVETRTILIVAGIAVLFLALSGGDPSKIIDDITGNNQKKVTCEVLVRNLGGIFTLHEVNCGTVELGCGLLGSLGLTTTPLAITDSTASLKFIAGEDIVSQSYEISPLFGSKTVRIAQCVNKEVNSGEVVLTNPIGLEKGRKTVQF